MKTIVRSLLTLRIAVLELLIEMTRIDFHNITERLGRRRERLARLQARLDEIDGKRYRASVYQLSGRR